MFSINAIPAFLLVPHHCKGINFDLGRSDGGPGTRLHYCALGKGPPPPCRVQRCAGEAQGQRGLLVRIGQLMPACVCFCLLSFRFSCWEAGHDTTVQSRQALHTACFKPNAESHPSQCAVISESRLEQFGIITVSRHTRGGCRGATMYVRLLEHTGAAHSQRHDA